MKRAFEQFKKYWLVNLITFLLSLVVGAIIFCIMFFLRGRTLLSAVDGAALGAISVLFLGLLFWMHHLGAFDTFVFGFKQLGSMLFAKDARRDGSYAEYRERKTESRNNSSFNFIAVIFAGLLLCVALLVLEIVYHASL
ncbi:MAG: DUF3899 domain-containing protein [Bacilli bacterium]|nr:DUF3899 domain-containing protein [Bacilli bacterium]